MKISLNFLKLSSKIGSNHLLVQGAGGNTSIKNDKSMWIKASGSWLMDSVKKNIFVNVDDKKIREGINSFLEDPLKDVLIEKTPLRPSIETTLHALMPYKIVIHTHPVELLAWLVLEGGQEKLKNLIKHRVCAWASYIRPGLELAHSAKIALEKTPSDVLFLGNHGLVVGSEDCKSAENIMKDILDICKKKPRKKSLINESELRQIGEQLSMRFAKYSIIDSLAIDEISYKYCNEKNGILYPDQAVFLGSKMHCYDGPIDNQSINFFIKKENSLPFIIIKGKGVLVSRKVSNDVDEILRCHAEVLSRIDEDQKLRYLTNDEVSRLLNWESEKYRQTIK